MSVILRFILIALAFTFTLTVVGGQAFAQNDETEEARLAAGKAKRRHYAGGKDEQELTVQVVLPAPTRYAQDVKPAPAAGSAREPVQEDAHD